MNVSRCPRRLLVMAPGLLDLDVADADLDGPRGEVAVANDLAAPGGVPDSQPDRH